jgi:hypothetical protein
VIAWVTIPFQETRVDLENGAPKHFRGVMD